MKTNNKHRGIALLLPFYFFTFLLLASCDSYLDNVPKGQKIPTTLEDFRVLMADEYTNQRTPPSQANILMNDVFETQATLSYDRLTRANYNWDTSLDRIKENKDDEATYYVCYGAISTANLILENAPTATEATDAERNTVMAQAKILRAMRYFTLVNYYCKQYDPSTASTDGGVPIITSAEVGAAYTQGSVQQVYDFILNDIKEALPDLPDKAENVLYADKATGYAFAARVYMQMGDYDQALIYARQALAINDKLFDWTAFYAENQMAIDDSTNYQTITSPMDYSFVENYNFGHGSSSYSRRDISIPIERGNEFEDGDVEFKSRWKKYTAGAETYYRGILAGYFNVGGMTTTEVYLIEAECLARNGQVSEAMDIVNKIRQNRILAEKYQPLTASTTAEALQIIMKVKDNAMLGSMVPFYDAKRWNKDSSTARTWTKTVDGEMRTLAPDSYFWVMPFPQGAINNSGNGTITQNTDK